MRKKRINETAIRTVKREKDGIGYKYDLIMRESARVASYDIPLYSIAVEMTDKDGDVSNANTADLFSDAGKAVVFFEKLVDSLATPIDLAYIVEDEFAR